MTKCSNLDSKSGIALIIVIGFLSILVILAVAFVISMRTERLATRGYVDSFKARHLLQVALARAVDDVDQSMVSNVLVYPAWEAFGSTGGSSNFTGILDGQASNYIPRSLLSFAWSEVNSSRVRWQTLSYNGTNFGRYAYLAVNCSGLLDANAIGGHDRMFGTNAHEIQADYRSISELVNTVPRGDTNLWHARTNKWIRYETVSDLNVVGRQPPIFLSGYPSNLFTFSYASVTQYIDPNGALANALCITGNESVLTAIQPQIESAFVDIPGFSPSDATNLSQVLLDYVDENSVPRSWASSCTEPTPLINEVVVSNRVTQNLEGTNVVYTNEYQLCVELWFPFHGVTNSTEYQLEISAAYSGANPSTFNPRPNIVNQTISLTGPWVEGSYRIATSPWRYSFAITNVVPNLAGAQVQLMLVLRDLSAAGGIVDRFQNPGMTIPIRPIPSAFPTNFGVGKAVNDPRLNWIASDTNQWVEVLGGAVTLGSFNQNVARPDALGCDGWGATNMYVRNGPLKTVGELGFLLQYSASSGAWHTIRLLDDEGNNARALPILDRFTLETNNFVKGLVNPNSYDTNVLGAVLFGVPVEHWSGEGAVSLDIVQAHAVARALVENQLAHGVQYTNLSSMAAWTETSIETYLPGVFDSVEKESIVRNSAGLLSPRQNMFTILLAAQVINDSYDVLAEQRAVAVVWRDPYPFDPSVSPVHSSFVRFFKWLTE